MNYTDALATLNSYKEALGPFDLRKIEELVKLCGLQLSKLKTIHVAGTNGKGSVSAMASSILREAGYLTGLYTSPHLISVRERIRLNGKIIPEDEFAAAVEWVHAHAQTMAEQPSHFEFVTAVAFKYFLDKNVDFLVAEVGMGGRLDATNLLMPEIAVITSIGLEHTRVLGNTLAQIAAEKAGIIKPDCHIVTAAKGPALNVIKKTAKQQGAKLVLPKWRSRRVSFDSVQFDLLSPTIIRNLQTSLGGIFQVENAALAAAAASMLNLRKFNVSESAIVTGLKNSFWPGRLQLIAKNPAVVLDVGHNAPAIRELAKSMQLFKFKKCFVVFSCLSDKNAKEMLKHISTFADKIFITRVSSERAMPTPSIAAVVPKKLAYSVSESVSAAISEARKIAQPMDLILATGSHFTVAEAMNYFGLKID